MPAQLPAGKESSSVLACLSLMRQNELLVRRLCWPSPPIGAVHRLPGSCEAPQLKIHVRLSYTAAQITAVPRRAGPGRSPDSVAFRTKPVCSLDDVAAPGRRTGSNSPAAARGSFRLFNYRRRAQRHNQAAEDLLHRLSLGHGEACDDVRGRQPPGSLRLLSWAEAPVINLSIKDRLKRRLAACLLSLSRSGALLRAASCTFRCCLRNLIPTQQ